MAEPILFCWSGGKDSALGLRALLRQKEFSVVGLLTTVTEAFERISMHGVRRELLLEQAESIGLPLQEVRIPAECSNAVYEQRMEQTLLAQFQKGVRTVAFGDIFLLDLRNYRERNLARVGMSAQFPLWGRDSRELISAFHADRFRAVAVCVDPGKLDRSFAGRELNPGFFEDLPEGVDPCGENGEFHTFVFDGPIFRWPVPFRRGQVVQRDAFVFCDLLPGIDRRTL
jgi:uncharacterized protein (TIGR00290 family)